MAAQVRIGGTTASVKLTGNDSITADQQIGFPDTNGDSAVVIVTPTSQDIETTGTITAGGRVTVKSSGGPDAYIYSGGVARVQLGDTTGSDNSMFQALPVGDTTQILSVNSAQNNTTPAYVVSSRPTPSGSFLRKFVVTTDGSLSIGGGLGVLPGTPNISLNASDGSITAGGVGVAYAYQLNHNQPDGGTFERGILTLRGVATNTENQFAIRVIREGDADEKMTVAYDGSITSAGKVSITTERAPLYAKRDFVAGPSNVLAQFANNTTNVIQFYTNGDIDANNVTFFLEPDNSANYVSTTNADGETEAVYNGPTLDVKDTLTKLVAAVTAIRAASQVAGTLEDLKSAITTATADFGGNN